MIEDAEYAAWALVSLDYAIADDVLTVVVEAMGIKRRRAFALALIAELDSDHELDAA